MKWLQGFKSKLPKHKYAINAAMLGDDDEFAWSNLGYWQNQDDTYPQACRQLAVHLATAVNLNSNDILLDLGCGKGASLLLWHDGFNVDHIEAVELQTPCVDKIQNKLKQIQRIQKLSFLNLNQESFEFKFDVALCIDAAYHSDLNSFLLSISSVLNSKARIGFHYLMLTEKFEHLNSFEKFRLKFLLKSADIQFSNVLNEDAIRHALTAQGFESIKIENLSQAVLFGFARYIQIQKTNKNVESEGNRLDRFKIDMTAKLCQKLYADGLVDYVQICAERRH